MGMYNEVCRGERSVSMVCHTCDDNHEGFCYFYRKWCSAVRKTCYKIKKVSTEGDKGKNDVEVSSASAQEWLEGKDDTGGLPSDNLLQEHNAEDI